MDAEIIVGLVFVAFFILFLYLFIRFAVFAIRWVFRVDEKEKHLKRIEELLEKKDK